MLKKSLSLMLCILMLTSVFTVSAARFNDVTESYDWAKESIESLAEHSIINGYPDGTFQPGKKITKEEAIALFARMLGASEEVNATVISLANVLYEDSLKNFDTFAKDAAAYLMYKRVLSDSDLATYLSSSNKGEPLKRYEAATLISKCLGGDVWLKSNPDVTLSFADADEVPAAAKGYVYFASEAGVMQGMENNKFMPMGNVTRAQVATMIYRILSQMNYTYSAGIITNIDSINNTVTLRDAEGETESYAINKNIAVMLDGEQAQLTLLSVGQEAVLTFSNGALYSLEVVVQEVDEVFEAIYKGKSTDTKGTVIKFIPMDSSETLTYTLADDYVISYNGASGSLSNLIINDFVKIHVESGKISLIEAESKNTTITGARVETITLEPDVVVTIRTLDNELISATVRSGASIRKNNAVTTFSDLVVGDKVDVTFEYGQISAVVAIGVEKKVSGSIEEITISKTNSSLLLNNGTTTTKYSISRDVDITLDGKAATLYDLRIGYEVDLVTSSATITEVKVKSVAAPMQITGQISIINTSYNMIVVKYTDANGNLAEKNVFLNSAKILDSNDGKIKTIRNLSVGQHVTIAGTENVGVFEASSLMILSNVQ
ncbi:MAG: S-layer homology domain-containing protein [Ruminococcaceae bacterium]|nr:S-layer homology domain-containing protein [Oscillospiraceae bacterium]